MWAATQGPSGTGRRHPDSTEAGPHGAPCGAGEAARHQGFLPHQEIQNWRLGEKRIAGSFLFPEPALLLCWYTDSKAKETTAAH